MVGMKNTDVMSKNIKELLECNLMQTYLRQQYHLVRVNFKVLIQRWIRESLFISSKQSTLLINLRRMKSWIWHMIVLKTLSIPSVSVVTIW